MSYAPDPNDLYYDDDTGLYRDSDTDDLYYDSEGTEPYDNGD